MPRTERYVSRLTDLHLIQQIKVTTKAIANLTNEEYRQNELRTLQTLQDELFRRFEDYFIGSEETSRW